jgi:hypothetical protein
MPPRRSNDESRATSAAALVRTGMNQLLSRLGVALALVASACLHLPSNKPSAEQQARADADATRACKSGVDQLREAYCDKAPAKVDVTWVDSAKTSRNSMANTCKNNPEQLEVLDTCIAQLETR